MKKVVEDGTPAYQPGYETDENVAARSRAGTRSSNRNAGKDTEEGIGGIAAEAEQELAKAEEAAETPAEEVSETPAEEATEPTETPVEEPAAAEEETPEAETNAEETPPAMAEETPAAEVEEAPAAPAVGSYVAPEGATHEELVDMYHDALMYGDTERAKALYLQLQEHRYAENSHRAKSEAQATQEAQDYVKTTAELIKTHPELGDDGIPANKVLALSDVYRAGGDNASAAIRKAVADLYPAAAEPTMPMEEAPMEETPAVEEVSLPDMAERQQVKRSLPTTPAANARSEATPAPEAPTRSSAIAAMKKSRGQE